MRLSPSAFQVGGKHTLRSPLPIGLVIGFALITGTFLLPRSLLPAGDDAAPEQIFAAVTVASLKVEPRPDLASAQAIPRPDPVVKPASSDGGTTYVIGDHLKLTFFERLDPFRAVDGKAPTAPASLIERTELTGEHVVDQRGRIAVPLLGEVDVAGVSGRQIAQQLETAYREIFGHDSRVSIAVVQREPIYLVGDGVRSGTYNFTPGMTVLHAMALSAPAGEGGADVYQKTEFVRAQQTLEESTQKLKRLLAANATVQAELSGEEVQTPTRLVELVGSKEAQTLMDEEARIMKVERLSRQAQITALQAAIAAASGEGSNLQRKVAILNTQIKTKEKRRSIVDKLRKQGDASAFSFYQTIADVGDFEERRADSLATIAAAQSRLELAKVELAKKQADIQLDLQRQFAANHAEMQQLETAIRSSRQLVGNLRLSTIRSSAQHGNIKAEILRRSSDGVKRIAATDMTELVPGDLIQMTAIAQSTD